MKIKTTTIALLLASIAAPALHAQETETQRFDCIADTWIRSNNLSWNTDKDKEKVEIRMDAIKEKDEDGKEITVDYAIFAALYGFEFNVPEGKKIQSARIRLVTERYKGSDIDIWGYSNDFIEEKANWESEEESINNTLEGTPIITITPKGQRNASLGSDAVQESYRNINEWTNLIDVTDYIKNLREETKRLNILITPTDIATNKNTNQNCFYTKEVKDVTNANDATLSFAREDLIPQLIVTFVEILNQEDAVLTPTVDTFVRSSAEGKQFGDLDEIEIYQYKPENGDQITFAGLMNFDFPNEYFDQENFKLKEAKLRLVTTHYKGKNEVDIYSYNYPMAENNTWETVGAYVLETLTGEPILSFNVNGEYNKNIKSNEISENMKSVEAWTNYIDFTDYIISNPSLSKLSILLNKPDNSNNAIKFATKEHNGMINEKDPTFTIDSEDLVPQLVMTFVSKNPYMGDIIVVCGDNTIMKDGTFTLDNRASFTISSKNATTISVNYGKDKTDTLTDLEDGSMTWMPDEKIDFKETPILIKASCSVDEFETMKEFVFSLTINEGRIQGDEDVFYPVLSNDKNQEELKLIADRYHEVYYDIYIRKKSEVGVENKKALKVVQRETSDEHNGYFKSVENNGHVTNIEDDGLNKTHTLNIQYLIDEVKDDEVKSLSDLGTDKLLLVSTYAYDPISKVYSPTIVYATGKDGTPTSIESVGVEMDGAVEYYDMHGRRVVNPEKGVYIKRQGSNVTKVVL